MMTTDQSAKKRNCKAPATENCSNTPATTSPLSYASVLLSKPTRSPTLFPQDKNTVSAAGIKGPEKRSMSATNLSRNSLISKPGSAISGQALNLSSTLHRRNRNRSHSSLLISTDQKARGTKVFGGKETSSCLSRNSTNQLNGHKSDATLCLRKSTQPQKLCVTESTRSGKESRRRRSRKRGANNMIRHCSLSTLEMSSLSNASTKRSDQRPLFLLSDFITSTPKRQETASDVKNRKLQPIDETKCQKIGKRREFPKVKRPSRLKQIILSERSTRRCRSVPGDLNLAQTLVTTTNSSSDKPSVNIQRQVKKAIQSVGQSALSVEQEDKIALLIGKLAEFQDRAYTRYAHVPFHRKRTKRFVCGLREVVKHLQLKHLSFVFLARDLEGNATDRCYELQSPPAVANDENAPNSECHSALPILESILQQIWNLATNADPVIPIIISQSRRRLAKLCHKPGRVSVVGILSVAGAEDLSKEILSMNLAINAPSERNKP